MAVRDSWVDSINDGDQLDDGYFNGIATTFVKKAGDTMTGDLELAGDPTSDADAARKAYVDTISPYQLIATETLDGTSSSATINFSPSEDHIMLIYNIWAPGSAAASYLYLRINGVSSGSLYDYTYMSGVAIGTSTSQDEWVLVSSWDEVYPIAGQYTIQSLTIETTTPDRTCYGIYGNSCQANAGNNFLQTGRFNTTDDNQISSITILSGRNIKGTVKVYRVNL